jgi:hypothetical protein
VHLSDLYRLYLWLAPFALMAGGALFVWLSLLLLEEYRKAFMAAPMSVMSLDVLMSILRCGAPGTIALLGLLVGAVFFGGGLLFLLGLLSSAVLDLWYAVRLTLGV